MKITDEKKRRESRESYRIFFTVFAIVKAANIYVVLRGLACSRRVREKSQEN